MSFHTFTFWLFFTLVYALFLCVRKNVVLRNLLLLIASYTFYAAWDWRFLSLILLTTVVSFTIALFLPRTRNKKLLLWISIVFNLCVLGFFKYFNFFTENIVELFSLIGLKADWPTLHIILPIGISFYTFQAIGYTVDVYREKIRPTRNFLNFSLFVAFFPQLIAGPIERASHLLPQLERINPLTKNALRTGLYLIVWGLVKKMVIADNAAFYADQIFLPGAHTTGLDIVLGGLSFTLQIYADFSGYSDIAKGLASLMGIELVWNFKWPYSARSPSEFWKRWHISLSEWFRDYVYIPLGGNRHGTLLTFRNLFVTMGLVGLWHGAEWPFVLWGVYHACLLILYRCGSHLLNLHPRAAAVFRINFLAPVLFFGFTVIGWILFRSESLSQFFALISSVGFQTNHPYRFLSLLALWMPILAIQAAQQRKDDLLIIPHTKLSIQCGFYLLCFYALILFTQSNLQQFVYFQF